MNDDIHIGNNIFTGTPGLYELLFMKKPAGSIITQRDKENYKLICELTNLHRVGADPKGRIRSTAVDKYTRFIGKLFPAKRKTGRGFIQANKKAYNYIYWDDVNEIVSRLQLLRAAKVAGNTSLDPEIASIEEELREVGAIY